METKQEVERPLLGNPLPTSANSEIASPILNSENKDHEFRKSIAAWLVKSVNDYDDLEEELKILLKNQPYQKEHREFMLFQMHQNFREKLTLLKLKILETKF